MRSFWNCGLAPFLVLLVLGIAACGGSPPPDTSSTGDLSVGVFAECELPTPLQPVLAKLTSALASRGIELSAEAILVYDHDLACGGNTLELLLGGGGAWTLGGALGIEHGELQEMLDNFDTTAGLLVTATVGLDFGGDWEGIQFAIDAYAGGDVFAAGGGTWKILWSTDKTEVGQTGFWASITVGSDGACSGGGIAFASQDDVNVLKTAWDNLTGQDAADAGKPSCSMRSADGGSAVSEASVGAEADGGGPTGENEAGTADPEAGTVDSGDFGAADGGWETPDGG